MFPILRQLIKRQISRIYLLLAVLTFCVTTLTHLPATQATLPPTAQPSISPQTMAQQGKTHYDAGQYTDAINLLQQAADAFQSQGDRLRQAMTLTNLALAYQQLGQWQNAQDTITTSLQLLDNAQTPDAWTLQGAAFNVQGQLYLAQGNLEAALDSFTTAVNSYTQTEDEVGLLHSQINQAQALQLAGMYRRALDSLQQIEPRLQQQPDSALKAIGLRRLGNLLRLVGTMDDAKKRLTQSLQVAQVIQSPEQISAAFLGLGNTARSQGEIEAALNYYQQAADPILGDSSTRIQAQLNQLSLIVATPSLSADPAFIQSLQNQISQLPASRTAIEARINLAGSLMTLQSQDYAKTSEIAQSLAVAVEQAKQLGDNRSQSLALGQLGALYEQTQQWKEAQDLTEQALVIAQSINAPDIAYTWQWQLGRLLKAQGKRDGAIAAYNAAVNTLESLRRDLVSINSQVQFSFRDRVEPIYRELVRLLLSSPTDNPDQNDLAQARDVIESLQQAELVNFFREDCLNANRIVIDEVDQNAAVIYPIVLGDRLDVVVSLPDAPLRHFGTKLPQGKDSNLFNQLRTAISPLSVEPKRGQPITIPESLQNIFRAQILVMGGNPRATSEEYLPLAQQLYDWLIRPIESDLAASGAKTLVFVLDSPLLNLPMAVLHDGNQFLIEKYAIAYTPGLQLLDPKPLTRGDIYAFTGGLSESRQGLPPLPFVEIELQQIKAQVSGQLLLNQEFTTTAIEQAIDSVPFPVVHLATHGQFSSKLEDTFILTWDNRLNINQLNTLLQTRAGGDRQPIELLVLSACQTATGDKRAALGLAGVAVRAGARSTLATLWFVNDAATADLMIRFYQELTDKTLTKAEALRRVQVSLLKEKKYQNPVYWAPFVLVGNWL